MERALKRADQSPFIHHQLALCYKRKKIAEQSRRPNSDQSTETNGMSAVQLNKQLKSNRDVSPHRSGAALEAPLYPSP